MRSEFPIKLRIPNADTAKVLAKVDRGEDVETFDSAEDLYATWER